MHEETIYLVLYESWASALNTCCVTPQFAPFYPLACSNSQLSNLLEQITKRAVYQSKWSKLVRYKWVVIRSTWWLLSWIVAVCIYSYRPAMKHLGNLRFMPQFSEGFDFAYLVGPIRTHELVWASWSWFGTRFVILGRSLAHFRMGNRALPWF